MWIDLLVCRVVFPPGRAKEWLASKVKPFDVPGSVYWTEAAQRATTDGLDMGSSSEATVKDILRFIGRLDVDIDVVTVRGSDNTGETTTMSRVIGAVTAFAHAHAFGGRGVLFELGVQLPFSDDGADLVHWLDDDGMHGARIHVEEALELRDRVKSFASDAFDPFMYTAHPSGDDTEYPDDDGFV